jgi:hypothetical protein
MPPSPATRASRAAYFLNRLRERAAACGRELHRHPPALRRTGGNPGRAGGQDVRLLVIGRRGESADPRPLPRSATSAATSSAWCARCRKPHPHRHRRLHACRRKCWSPTTAAASPGAASTCWPPARCCKRAAEVHVLMSGQGAPRSAEGHRAGLRRADRRWPDRQRSHHPRRSGTGDRAVRRDRGHGPAGDGCVEPLAAAQSAVRQQDLRPAALGDDPDPAAALTFVPVGARSYRHHCRASETAPGFVQWQQV